MSLFWGNSVDIGCAIGAERSLGLSAPDRARHTYVVGSTRTGKTKLLEDMCRQDLLQWPNSACPMVVIDPHGTLYSGLMGYAAAEGFDEWPIIPIDFRRDDMIVSYNLLRRREGTDPAVICRSFVESILHAWGQSNTNETPRLATWLETILMLAYERECSLSEAMQVMRNPELRRLVTSEVQHVVARGTLESASALREGEFQDRVESTVNRVNRFLSTQVLRATLCPSGESLDLGKVLDQGGIILANLSVEGTKIAAEDASALGSVLLTDLWTAARRRGKREEGDLRPCYVYIDEFQNFVTPTIARGLSEASGFGLHLTLAHQYPSQLPDAHGELGTMILNSVLANAKNKIVFQLSHPEDLESLTSIMYRQSVDTQKVKSEIHGTKVVGHELTYLPSYSQSTSKGTQTGWQYTRSEASGRSTSAGASRSTTQADADTTADGITRGESSAEAETRNVSETQGSSRGTSTGRGKNTSKGVSKGEGENWSSQASDSSGSSSGSGKGRSGSQSFGPPTEEFQEKQHGYQRGKKKAAFEREYSTGSSISDSENSSESQSHQHGESSGAGGNRSRSESESSGESESQQSSEAQSRSLARGQGTSRTSGKQHATNRSRAKTTSTGSSESFSYSEAMSEQHGESWGESGGDSESYTEGTTWGPALIPVMGTELSSREFASVEEQLFEFSQILDGQPDRHCIIRLASMPKPVAVYTLQVDPPLTTREWTDEWAGRMLAALPFATPMNDALNSLKDREASFAARVFGTNGAVEPVAVRRRLKAQPKPAQD